MLIDRSFFPQTVREHTHPDKHTSSMGASQSTATLRDALSRLRKETVAADDAAFWDGVWSVKGKRRKEHTVCVCARVVCVVMRERGAHTFTF